MQARTIIKELERLSNPDDVAGMARFGIQANNAYGVRMPELTRIAREAGKNHVLAGKLWKHGYTETRILAAMIDDPKLVTPEQMESWAMEFNSWDVCDQCCMKLFRKTPYAYHKIDEWYNRKEEFVKRAAFTLIATLAVHDRKAEDQKFVELFPIIVGASTDERNFVKKAVNWALRQIGKRNQVLNLEAIKLAKEIEKIDSPSSRWIAKDALRELKSEKVQVRLEEKALKSR
jgi:3-methyladenine DNA glycosylase AlkD